MSPKLYKSSDVCEMAQVQPYVLRSWEKEFPGIGVSKPGDGQRLYRQSDIEQVLRIKQLVFTEGLTLSGARRRIESSTPGPSSVSDAEVAEVLDALAADARTRVANVREGLRSVLRVLSSAPGTVVLVDEFKLVPLPVGAAKPAGRGGSGRSAALKNSAVKRSPVRRGIPKTADVKTGAAATTTAAARTKPRVAGKPAVASKPKAKRASV